MASNFVVFKEIATGIAVTVSKRSLEYPDYDSMEQQGYYLRVMEGQKRECLDKESEINEELSIMEL